MKRLIPLFFLLLLASCASEPRAVTFNGDIYRRETGSAEVYLGPGDSTLTVERGAQATTVTAGGQVYRVTGTESQMTVTFPDGRELTRRSTGSGSSGSAPLGVDASLEDWQRVDELHAIVFPPQGRPAVGRFALAALLALVGLLQLANPRLAFQIAEGWRYQNLEPSDAYLTLSRLGGAALLVLALLLALGVWG